MEFIQEVPYIHAKAAELLAKVKWGDIGKYKGKRVCDVYEDLLNDRGTWPKKDRDSFDKLKQAIFNGLFLAVQEANNVSESKLEDLMGITGIDREVAQALYNAGYKKKVDFVEKPDVYLRKRSCEIYDDVCNSVEIGAWGAPDVWCSILTALTLMATPPGYGPSVLRPP